MRPIETEYLGITFRSRPEARWCVFLDAMNVGWLYEQRCVQFMGGNYTPDLWLPKREVFAEIKPVWPTGFEVSKMRSVPSMLLLIGLPAFADYWLLQYGVETLIILDEDWPCSPMDKAAHPGWFSMAYHRAVDRAVSARFDSYDQDRDSTRRRYE